LFDLKNSFDNYLLLYFFFLKKKTEDMKSLFLISVVLCLGLFGGFVSSTPAQRNTFNHEFFEQVKEVYSPYLEEASEKEKLKFAYTLHQSMEARHLEEQQKVKAGQTDKPMVYFNCTTYGPSPVSPTNVHQLRPGDIGIVAALGDSITAGFGADAGSIFCIFTEWRGLSWSIGGDEDASTILTVPNVLKQYNPNIKGWAVGTGKQNSKGANLNMAVSGAIATDMPTQAQQLIDRIKANSTYDYENAWKLVTIFIGGNDLCRICKDESAHSGSVYRTSMEQALDLLQTNLPKTLVNLVPVVDVTELSLLTSGLCVLLHPFECGCGTGGSSGKAAAQAGQAAYIEESYALANLSKYQTDDQFTVVVQPFLTRTQVPLLSDGKPDSSYFAPDCFHFAEKAHAAAAVGLWNNMFEPMDAKKTAWVVNEPFDCPAEGTYIVTNVNNAQNKKN
jgi:phospholipase B1